MFTNIIGIYWRKFDPKRSNDFHEKRVYTPRSSLSSAHKHRVAGGTRFQVYCWNTKTKRRAALCQDRVTDFLLECQWQEKLKPPTCPLAEGTRSLRLMMLFEKDSAAALWRESSKLKQCHLQHLNLGTLLSFKTKSVIVMI